MNSFTKWWTVIALFLATAAGVSAADSVPASDASVALATQVRDIFKAKCTDCHGADLERPKGHFGYVLDLGRVAANPKLVVPGDSTKSEIYRLVNLNKMPKASPNTTPLTAAEKEIVKRWIDAGARRPSREANQPTIGARRLIGFCEH